MPTIRYTAKGGAYRVGGYGFDPGDEKDVEDELAEYLADHDEFELVDGEAQDSAVEDEKPESEEEANDDDGEGAPTEDDSTDERALDLADKNYQTAVAAVKDGEADEFLDALGNVDDRKSVQEAIDERRAELDQED